MRRAVSKFIPNKFGRNPSDLPMSSHRLDHGSVEDFYISLDSPHKSWAPGDEISGQVILRSKKNLANIAISFNLSGYVKIHALPHSKLRPMKTVLFSHTIQIYGPDSRVDSSQEFANGLYKGEHRFPFIVKLPNKRIFTSIDFGKGAIVYVLLAHLVSADSLKNRVSSLSSKSSTVSAASGTITPNTGSPEISSLFKAKEAISKIHHPSYSYEKIINLVNPIDVAHLLTPKRKRLMIKHPRKSKLLRAQSSSSTINTISSITSTNPDIDTASTIQRPTSADLSSVSAVSQVLLLAASAHTGSPQNTAVSPGGASLMTHSKDSSDTIRVLMDVAQRGFLRGELIPIKLSINHLRKIQDSTGIIVTLVRVCRIDYGPDGYYESFRKDLQQLVIPLFVDPNTFSLEISTSMRVPADAFPTISGCPLVSFQYFVEVMLNLSGKSLSLTTPSEQPKSSTVPQEDSPQSLSLGQASAASFNFQSLANSRSEFINTDKFKRLKKFIQMTVEVVIGTHRLIQGSAENASSNTSLSIMTDSAQTLSVRSLGQKNSSPQSAGAHATHAAINTVPEGTRMENFDSPPYLYEPLQLPGPTQSNGDGNVPAYESATVTPPIPDVPAMSEKDRMRQHEASLLPSAPDFEDSDSDDEAAQSLAAESPLHDEGVMMSCDSAAEQAASQCSAYATHNPDGVIMPDGLNSDELYEVPDIHEGIGLEGVTDYVPKYTAAKNNGAVKP